MNKSEWYDGLNNIDAGIVEEYIEEKKRLAVLRKKEKQMAENRSCCGVFCGYSLFAHSFNFKPNRRKALPFADGY